MRHHLVIQVAQNPETSIRHAVHSRNRFRPLAKFDNLAPSLTSGYSFTTTPPFTQFLRQDHQDICSEHRGGPLHIAVVVDELRTRHRVYRISDTLTAEIGDLHPTSAVSPTNCDEIFIAPAPKLDVPKPEVGNLLGLLLCSEPLVERFKTDHRFHDHFPDGLETNTTTIKMAPIESSTDEGPTFSVSIAFRRLKIASYSNDGHRSNL